MAIIKIPKISVIIYSYNFDRFLSECIKSILSQTLRPHEIIICDDHSTDKSWEIICNAHLQYPELIRIYRHNDNLGMTANGNFGFKQISGNLISWIDGDDKWMPEKLELEWKVLRTNPDAKIAYSNVFVIDNDGKRKQIWDNGQYPKPPTGDAFVQVYSRRFFPNSNSVFRNHLMYNSVFDKIGFFDENLEIYIDWDFKIRATANYPIVYSDAPTVEYRIHRQGISNSPREILYRDMIRVYEKNLHLTKNREWYEKKSIKNYVEKELKTLMPRDNHMLKTYADANEQEEKRVTKKPNSRKNGKNISTESRKILKERSWFGENIIFLISLPRSGSTLLQRILSGHSSIHSIAEPWIMLHPLYALKKKGCRTEYDADLARQGLEDFLSQVPEGNDLYFKALRSFGKVMYKRSLELSGKRYFLDKTPRYHFIIPELRKVFPKAKFIFLLRNPLAVLSSILKAWCQNKPEILRNSPLFLDIMHGPLHLIQGIQILENDAVVVKYEELVADTETTVKAICYKLGIPYQTEMLTYGSKPNPIGRFGDSIGIIKHDKAVPDYIDSWVCNLQSTDLYEFSKKYIESLGHEIFELMGYSYPKVKNKLKTFNNPNNCSDEQKTERTNYNDDASIDYQDVKNSIITLETTLKKNPSIAEAHNDLGVHYYRLGKKEMAFSRYKEAVRINPQNITFMKNLADYYYVELGKIEDAMQLYVKVLRIEPKDIETLLVVGHLCVSLEKFSDAKNFYNRIIEIDPDHEEARNFIEKLNAKSQEIAQNQNDEEKPLVENLINLNDIDLGKYLVSAIVSTYNAEKFIRGCLEDLENQTIADRLEIVVVNSGSKRKRRGDR